MDLKLFKVNGKQTYEHMQACMHTIQRPNFGFRLHLIIEIAHLVSLGKLNNMMIICYKTHSVIHLNYDINRFQERKAEQQ